MHADAYANPQSCWRFDSCVTAGLEQKKIIYDCRVRIIYTHIHLEPIILISILLINVASITIERV